MAYDSKNRMLYLRFRSGDVYRYFEFRRSSTGSFYRLSLEAVIS